LTAGPAVIDTNVVVSGLLTASPASPTARILDGMLRGRFRFLLSIELLSEYRGVLLRPRIRRHHRFSEKEVDLVLTDIAAAGVMLEIGRLGPRPPGGDGHLWQILAAVPDAVLVTGDRRLFGAPAAAGRVVSPRAITDGLPGWRVDI
jgi:predicted nucleic acid-binding protein